MTFFDYVAILLTLACSAIWLSLYLRYGREYQVPPASEPLSTPPGDWTPVQLSRLWTHDVGSLRDPIASLLDLVQRGALLLLHDPVTVLSVGGLAGVSTDFEYTFARSSSRRLDLTLSERYLIDEVIFRGSNAELASLTAVCVEGARRQLEIHDRLAHWRALAWQEPVPLAFEEERSERASKRGYAIGLTLMLLGLLVGVAGSAFAFLSFALGGVMLATSGCMKRRSLAAVEAMEQWKAYRWHLCENTSVAHEPAHAVMVWSRHLVYAVTLGVATETIRQFRLLVPDREGIQQSRWMYD